MTIELARSPPSVMPGPTALPPGFRFHPTDEELIIHYLRKRAAAAAAAPCPTPIIAEVDIYKFDPWDLPAKALFGEREWYFFSPRDRKYPNGIRPNRAAGSGYWKATGTDKPIQATAAQYGCGMIGVKKALVFYKGRPPRGIKTNWIMHEYRFADSNTAANSYRPPIRLKDSSITMRLDDWVLCRIYKKTNHQMSPMLAPSHDDSLSHDTDAYVPPRMPKPPSISDYLEDYSAVSELFDSLPETAPPTAAAGSSRFFVTDSDEAILTQHYGSQKRQLEDCNNGMLHASKRLLSDASMPINSLPIYGPGQPSQNSI